MSRVRNQNEVLATLEEAAKEKGEEVSQYFKQLVESAKGATDHVMDKTKTAAHEVDRSVHSNPWPYLGGAALLGFLVGVLIRPRS